MTLRRGAHTDLAARAADGARRDAGGDGKAVAGDDWYAGDPRRVPVPHASHGRAPPPQTGRSDWSITTNGL